MLFKIYETRNALFLINICYTKSLASLSWKRQNLHLMNIQLKKGKSKQISVSLIGIVTSGGAHSVWYRLSRQRGR